MLSCLSQFGHVDCNAASFLDASRSGGCSGAVVSGSAVLVQGVEELRTTTIEGRDDAAGLVAQGPVAEQVERLLVALTDITAEPLGSRLHPFDVTLQGGAKVGDGFDVGP